MAIGTASEDQLVTGLSSTAPVTGPANVITPDAVNSLVDSFGKGVITGDDLAKHTGIMAYLRNRAEGQQLRESVSPEAITARRSALGAQTAQANLVQAQAAAQGGLVAPQTTLAASQLQKQQAEVWDKNAVDIFKEYNPTIYKEDGTTPDTEGMAEAGRSYLRARDALTYAGQGLASQPSKELDPDTNQPIVVQRNSIGEDVTPREDNPAYTHYRDMRQKAIETLFAPSKPHASRGAGTDNEISDAPSSGMITSPGQAPLVSPMAPPVAPSIGVPVYQSGTGRAVGEIPGTTIPETLDRVSKEPQYEFWSQKLGSIRDFQKAARNVYSPVPPEDMHLGIPTMNERDFALLNSIRQLATPVTSGSAGGRGGAPDLQGAKIEESLPLYEKLQDVKQVLAHTGALTEGTRRRLVKLGNDYVRSKEETVRPVLQWAAENSKATPEKLWGTTSDQARLMRGESMTYEPPQEAGSGRPGYKSVTLSSGRTVLVPQ